MFNNKTEDEIDFCESYKSEILNNVTQEKSSSFGTVLKILTILLLLAIIVALSIYGYNYFLNKKSSDDSVPNLPSSIQISDEDLKVIDESSDETQESISNKEENLSPLVNTSEISSSNKDDKLSSVVKNSNEISTSSSLSTIDESDINKIANSVKVVISQKEEKEEKTVVEEKPVVSEPVIEEKSLEVPTLSSSPEAKYLEDLAKLSKEIEKESKNK